MVPSTTIYLPLCLLHRVQRCVCVWVCERVAAFSFAYVCMCKLPDQWYCTVCFLWLCKDGEGGSGGWRIEGMQAIWPIITVIVTISHNALHQFTDWFLTEFCVTSFQHEFQKLFKITNVPFCTIYIYNFLSWPKYLKYATVVCVYFSNLASMWCQSILWAQKDHPPALRGTANQKKVDLKGGQLTLCTTKC